MTVTSPPTVVISNQQNYNGSLPTPYEFLTTVAAGNFSWLHPLCYDCVIAGKRARHNDGLRLYNEPWTHHPLTQLFPPMKRTFKHWIRCCKMTLGDDETVMQGVTDKNYDCHEDLRFCPPAHSFLNYSCEWFANVFSASVASTKFFFRESIHHQKSRIHYLWGELGCRVENSTIYSATVQFQIDWRLSLCWK